MVIFAEPVFTTHLNNKFAQLEPNSAAALLLPGDRLLEVNGRNVQDTSREDIIDIIRQSGTSVTLRVRDNLLFSVAFGTGSERIVNKMSRARWRLPPPVSLVDPRKSAIILVFSLSVYARTFNSTKRQC